jgi:hypothetical protein
MVTAVKNIAPIAPKAPNLPIAPVDYSRDQQDNLLKILRIYFNSLDGFNQAIAIPDSGTTANRPNAVNFLLIGQQYFDTTLGIPIFWRGSNWVNASGTVV